MTFSNSESYYCAEGLQRVRGGRVRWVPVLGGPGNLTGPAPPGRCLYWVPRSLCSLPTPSLALPHSLFLLLLMASWLQYKQCYCYLGWPLSYFIPSLRFCQLLAANRYKNSPLVVMKDMKMQRGSWASPSRPVYLRRIHCRVLIDRSIIKLW